MKRFFKFLHTVGAIGFAGGIAAYLVIASSAPEPAATAEFVSVRSSIANIARWMIMPSMLLVVTSGLLSMAFHFPFQDKGWVWAKAVSGLLVFEASLASVDAPAKQAAAAAALALGGDLTATELTARVNDKWGALWILLGLSVANVILAIWRPRFIRSSKTGSEAR